MPSLSSLLTDPVKEREGVWATISGGLEVLVARVSSPAYRSYCRERLSSLSKLGKQKDYDEKAEEILKKAAAMFLLLDWKDLTDDQGSPIPYSWERAEEIFVKSDDIYREVMAIAQNRDLYRLEQQREIVGN